MAADGGRRSATRGDTVRIEPNSAIAEKNRAHVIELLAGQTHRPADEVKRVFDHEFARLKSDAQVLDFLEVLAARSARDVLARAH
jgi:Protein of unknown function (DUF3562)